MIKMVSICGLTPEEVTGAINATSEVFDYNVIPNRFDIYQTRNGYRVEVTLKVKDSNGPGARIGHTGRRMINACWHVYGEFFEELMLINPAVSISQCGQLVTKDNNWTDRNIGSSARPLMYSDACKCKKNGIHKAIMIVNKL